MRLVDLTQPWGYDTPPFPGQSGPTIRWIKRLSMALSRWRSSDVSCSGIS